MLTIGRYRARRADTQADLAAAQHLRALSFLGRAAPPDADAFDPVCTHIIVRDQFTDQLVCCFRMLLLASGDATSRSYSAQFYDLSALETFRSPMAEVGRFCIHPEARDADILRVAWGGMARFVDENGVRMLFGCSSFKGNDANPYLDAFALLRNQYLAPDPWLPGIKSTSVFRFADLSHGDEPDRRAGLRVMPPLLRTYLGMGGWVSDHAVIDPLMNTLHVFTGLEIDAVPDARKRVLRAMAEHSAS
ncbi:MAG: GNAT family N-acyltransferase [Pseudomonadota bacterium]